MELALIAGVGLLGYRLAARGARPRYTTEVTPLLDQDNDFPFQPQTDAHARIEADARQAAQHVRRVEDEMPDLHPHVTNDARQAFHEGFAQRRLEMYTGSDAQAFRHRSERGALFAPEERRTASAVSSGGAPRALVDAEGIKAAMVEREAFGGRYNNVAPVERVNVGPGLGVAATVPATGGFHPMYRHLPLEDLNAHRINQLPARTNHGARPTADRTAALPDFKTTKVDLSHIAVPVGNSKAAGIQAQELVSKTFEPPRVRRVDAGVGPVGPARVNTAGAVIRPDATKERRAGLGGVVVDVNSGALRGPGIYEGYHAKPTDRGWANPVPPAPMATSAGMYASAGDGLRTTMRDGELFYTGGAFYGGSYADTHPDLKPTDREWAGDAQGAGAYAATVRAAPLETDVVLRGTTRDTFAQPSMGSMGVRAVGTARSFTGPTATLRETTGQLPVLAGSRPGAAMSRRDAGFRKGKVRAHASHTAIGAMPVNAHTPIRVEVRAPLNQQGIVHHGSFARGSGPREDPRVAPRNKLVAENPRAPPKPLRQQT